MEKEIAVTIAKSKNHRLAGEGACYIVSKRNRTVNREAQAGKISLATIKHAAKLLIQDTHELCTDAQIEQYEKDMIERRDISQQAAARLKGIAMFNSTPPVNEVSK
jgi:methionine synthase II (cobalamin-independent)